MVTYCIVRTLIESTAVLYCLLRAQQYTEDAVQYSCGAITIMTLDLNVGVASLSELLGCCVPVNINIRSMGAASTVAMARSNAFPRTVPNKQLNTTGVFL